MCASQDMYFTKVFLNQHFVSTLRIPFSSTSSASRDSDYRSTRKQLLCKISTKRHLRRFYGDEVWTLQARIIFTQEPNYPRNVSVYTCPSVEIAGTGCICSVVSSDETVTSESVLGNACSGGQSLWHTCWCAGYKQLRGMIVRQKSSFHSTGAHGQMCVLQKKREAGGEIGNKVIWNRSKRLLDLLG